MKQSVDRRNHPCYRGGGKGGAERSTPPPHGGGGFPNTSTKEKRKT